MPLAQSVSDDLAHLSETCARMGSPFFAALLGFAAAAYVDDGVFRALVDRHAHRSRVGLRLGGAAHYRALSAEAAEIAAHYPSTGGDGDARAAWHAIARDIHRHADRYDELFAREVQTNEVARAMPVLAAMLALADAVRMPLRIFEVGSSAGLLLNFDRYRYGGEGWNWGNPESPVRLRNHIIAGAPSHLDASLSVIERRGCDLHPLNAANAQDADTLLSFVWPDQTERFERLRAAIALARTHPLRIAQAGGTQWARANAQPHAGAASVLLHTVIVEHLSAKERESLLNVPQELGSRATGDAPFGWVRMEIADKGYETRLTRWPGKVETLIATSDGHAQNLAWHRA